MNEILSKRRAPGRPLGTIRGVAPLLSVRYRLAPETIAIIDRCAADAGMSRAAWLNFTIADLASDGKLLAQRRERDLKLREMSRLVTNFNKAMNARSTQDFIEHAANALQSESENATLL